MTDPGSPKFWFKATATTPAYLPISFEGGLYATTVKTALAAIDTRSRYWNIKHINTVHLYQMDKHGVIDKDPIVSTNYALERAKGRLTSSPLIVPGESVKYTDTVMDKYNNADWLHKLDTPDPFPLVRHNEEKVT